MRTLWQVACVMILSGAALGQPDPSGIEFVTVGAPGNAPMTDPRTPPDNRMFGRGSVSYEYKIGKYETTSAQWAEFLNAYRGQSTPHPFWSWDGPVHSGMSGNQFSGYSTTPATAMFPLGGLTWRMSALYCNWLHNGKGSDAASLLTGAYDTSTWGDINGRQFFTDAESHLPGARYWIPTVDEQMKAMHYDPNRYGMNQGGWWMSKNMSDEFGISGPPGVGTTNAGWQASSPAFGEWQIPLGAYTDSLSPWGLFDTSGGASEWSETVTVDVFGRQIGRVYAFSHAGSNGNIDWVHSIGDARPSSRLSYFGLRVATAIPSPSVVAIIILSGRATWWRRRSREQCKLAIWG